MNIFLFLFLTLTTPLLAAEQNLIYCSEGSPVAFNPQVTTDGTSSNAASYTIYNRLVDFKEGTTEVIPSLAETFDISKDKLTYTFNLRKNVKFHTTKYFTPTRNFNADDVIFSFNRQMDKTNPYHLVGGGIYEYFQSMEMDKLIKSVEKIDQYKIKITLSQPNAAFLANLAMPFMSILSLEYAEKLIKEKNKDEIDQSPIGTGPFIFINYAKDNLIRFKGNISYFEGAPKIKQLIFSITPDANVRFQKLRAGECHFIIEPSPSDLPIIKGDKKFIVLEGPGLNVSYLALNTSKPPFDKLEVRLAINHALNKNAYIKAIYLDNAIPAKNPIPPTIWSYNNKIKDYDYNPKKSLELLKKAGLEKGFETEIWTLPINRPYNPNGKKMGEMMQADLAKIGIKAKLVTYDWGTYLAKANKGEHQLIQMGWTGDNGDPDNFLNVLLSCQAVKTGSNYARWCNKEFNDLIQNATIALKKKDRIKLYQKAQEVFKKDAPWVTLAHSTVYRAMSTQVKGYKISPLGHDIFTHVSVE
jgi:dipeptide transport system substrate-binding protein